MSQTTSEASTKRPMSSDFQIAVWAIIAAFGCYFSMYGFRKPFTAASYQPTFFLGIDYKTVLVTAQVIGYTLSKFIGIRVIAEMQPERRSTAILWLIGTAWVALLLFAVVPRPWNFVCLFFNGLPLGMVFGLVLGFLEGRRLTEALAAALCASFILADGVTKTIGSWLLQLGVAEDWMPATAGGIYLVPLVGFVWMLRQIPPPHAEDVAARAARTTMGQQARWSMLSRYGLGLLLLSVTYLLVTISRSIRADFQPEIWESLGGIADAGVFTRTELWVTLGVTLVNGASILIRDNRLAFAMALLTCVLGFLITVTALWGLQQGTISGFTFMVLTGLGLYFPYVAFHTTIFERLLAMTRDVGNIGFLMYVVDATGYLGYVGVMIARKFTGIQTDVLQLLIQVSWVTVWVGVICLLGAFAFFTRLANQANRVDIDGSSLTNRSRN